MLITSLNNLPPNLVELDCRFNILELNNIPKSLIKIFCSSSLINLQEIKDNYPNINIIVI